MADVDGILERGRAAHPEVSAPDDRLAPLVSSRFEGEAPDIKLDAAELFLAAACAAGDTAALATFERLYFQSLPGALSRLSLNRDEIDEVAQLVRVRLFVAEPGEVARVVGYAGLGQLGGLIRVAAIRAGLNLLRDRGRLARSAGEGDDDELDDIPIATDDPQLAQLKAQHRTAFKAAFEAAIASLAPRERSLLNLALVKGLGIDRIGAIYGVHRATAARWVASARENLTKGVHKLLGQRLGVRDSELDSLLPLVESQLELSLERLLKSRAE